MCLPIVGDVKGMLEVRPGNYVTGETLGSFERYLGAGLMLIPVVGKYVVKIGAKALKVGKDISLQVADTAVTVAGPCAGDDAQYRATGSVKPRPYPQPSQKASRRDCRCRGRYPQSHGPHQSALPRRWR